jgi:phage-related protein
MTLPTFPATPGPAFPVASQRNPLIITNTFGDGYMQEVHDGPNAGDIATTTLKWELLTRADKDALEAFLETNGGAGRFKLTPPGESVQHVYNCSKWTWMEVEFNNWSLTASLTRDFLPE